MLSIVYITCNRSSELKLSIMSCEAHVKISHEYVVVDNGSTDSTGEMLNELIGLGVPIVYLYQKENQGVSGGRNIAFEAAKGDICYFIDDDATIISEGNKLDEAYSYLKSNDSVVALGTDCYDTERDCQLIGLKEKNDSLSGHHRIRNYIGCSHFIKKNGEPFGKSVLYPANLMYGSEELYAGLTAYTFGKEIRQFSDLKVLHKPSSSTREKREIRQRNGHINTYVIKKYFLPGSYSIISTLLFLMRICRFEKMNVKKIVEDIRQTKIRYDSKYKNTMDSQRVKYLIKLFGIKNVL